MFSLIRIKRKRKKEKIENILTGDWIKTHSKEDLTEVRTIFSLTPTKIEFHYRVCSTCAPTVSSKASYHNRKAWRKFSNRN